MGKNASVVWFRQDLRLEDQPALKSAIDRGGAVIALYIWAPEEEGDWAIGSASRWWLHHSLESFHNDLRSIGLSLVLRRGPSLDAIIDVMQKTGADSVFWNRRYEPLAAKRDADVKAKIQEMGMNVHVFNSSLLYEPWSIATKEGRPYQVFTPFWKACLSMGEPEAPKAKPGRAASTNEKVPSEDLGSFSLLPKLEWDAGIKACWLPGSEGARTRLREAVEHVIPGYPVKRDLPAANGTSMLSPYLHFGEVSPRMVWHAVRKKWGDRPEAAAFLRQLIWREFAFSLLFHFPRTSDEGLRKEFDAFPWNRDKKLLKAWTKGETGFPLVDAGMRQLWQTGWMHNRVRMVVGSFLVKDMLIDWREGARWFWDTLVDADLPNNTFGWQWVGGCGADAAPYFRIFNPVLQGEKFDPSGDYVRKWVPELGKLPNRWIHRPWEASPLELHAAEVELGKTYPLPIVDHAQARERALEAYAQMRKKGEMA